MSKKVSNLLTLLSGLSNRRNEPSGVRIDKPLDLQTYLPFRFHRLSVLLANESMELVDKTASHNLKIRDWRLMVLLASLGPLTNREITKLANMNAATISRAMSHLTKLGFVVSGADPYDKRKTVMSLTENGGAIYNELALERSKSGFDIGVLLSKEEQETLFKIFDQIEQQMLSSSNSKLEKYDWNSK